MEFELPREFQKPRLRRSEASAYLLLRYQLQVAVATLAKLASVGGGPPYQKPGATPLYPREHLDEWAVKRLGRLRSSTSDEGEAA